MTTLGLGKPRLRQSEHKTREKERETEREREKERYIKREGNNDM